jgi:hypothetical protein
VPAARAERTMLWDPARLLRSSGGYSRASGQPAGMSSDDGALHRRAPKTRSIPAPLRQPSPDPARAPSFISNEGFKPRIWVFLSCPAKCLISNQFSCFKSSLVLISQDVPSSLQGAHFDFPERRKWLKGPSSCADLAGLPSADFLATSWAAGARPLLWILNFERQKSIKN